MSGVLGALAVVPNLAETDNGSNLGIKRYMNSMAELVLACHRCMIHATPKVAQQPALTASGTKMRPGLIAADPTVPNAKLRVVLKLAALNSKVLDGSRSAIHCPTKVNFVTQF